MPTSVHLRLAQIRDSALSQRMQTNKKTLSTKDALAEVPCKTDHSLAASAWTPKPGMPNPLIPFQMEKHHNLLFHPVIYFWGDFLKMASFCA